MAAKVKYMKGCQSLAEMATRNTQKRAPFEQLNQNDLKPGQNVVFIGNSIVLACP